MRKTPLALLPLVFTWLAYADNWSSGGGEIRTDSHNPWFVENTKQVTYCIEIDDENFGVDIDIARSKIEAGFAYWERQFREAETASYVSSSTLPAVQVKLATQSFFEVSCSQAHDMKFQLGTLTDMQKAYLKDPKHIVGVAVRTNYDRANMKGQGFVYISPERGPLALTATGIKENRWQIDANKRLEEVLVHELGHVFGLLHQEGIMRDGFAEGAIRGNIHYPDHPDAIDNFFVLTQRNSLFRSFPYRIRKANENILGIPESSIVTVEINDYADGWLVSYEHQGEVRPLGTLRIVRENSRWSNINRKVTIVMPEDQRVFEPYIGQPNVRLEIGGAGEMTYNCRLYDMNDKFVRGIILRVEPTRMWATSAYSNGEIALNFMTFSN